MYLVYLLPLLLIVVILAVFAPPLLAAIVFVLFLIGLGAYKFLGPGTDPEHAPAPQEAEPPAQTPTAARTRGASSEERAGIWGEKRPES